MALATPGNSSPQNSRYAFLVILFITIFLFTIFVFTKRGLEPSIFLYKTHFTQIPFSSSSSSSSTNNSNISSSSSTQPTQQTSESNYQNVQHPDPENENVQHPDREKDQTVGQNENPDGEMCDLFMGSWVKDEQYPLYEPGSCPHVDEAYDCQNNGRNDFEYLKWRWKPQACDLPWFNATDFLVRLQGKRLMFVGDSMNRNQFESMLCLLREGLHNKSGIYEVHGYKIVKDRGNYIFKIQDYNCTVEYGLSHFLVKEGENNSNPSLSIDQIDKNAEHWKKADILVFNTGHWWSHGKTKRGKNYYKEGDYLYPQLDADDAFRRALKTWASWVELNINLEKQLIFYRGHSTAHFRGGDWDSGGTCHGEDEPAFSGAILDSYPLKMKIVDEVINQMKVPVKLLNVTRLTNFRKDGHPSIYGNKGSNSKQDCSHWCVPGVPDAWNELIYATLVFQQTKSKGSTVL